MNTPMKALGVRVRSPSAVASAPMNPAAMISESAEPGALKAIRMRRRNAEQQGQQHGPAKLDEGVVRLDARHAVEHRLGAGHAVARGEVGERHGKHDGDDQWQRVSHRRSG